ncbi:ROK family protein [Rubrobacter calidifluminis]|uniref:ROK family protein n=1 Tax=Rubrobacter calidifluminis TaxID=1392640 RepID=UPI00235E289D|nr:ROK family protein [Rubrobacter calidifluminis]
MAVAAIDVGGTKTRVEIFSGREKPLGSTTFETPRDGDVAGRVGEAVLALAAGERIDAAAAASPGPLDPRGGVILNPPNLSREWWGLEFAGRMEEILGCPATLENDANLGALGEAVYGGGRGYGSVLYITVSTGVGTGLVVDGVIFGGSRGFAAELGHTVITDDERVCGCGRRGCVEAVASGTAIARRALETGWAPQDGGEVTALAVATAAASGDRRALAVLSEAAGYLGRAIVNFVYAYDPEVVLLGGGVAQSDLFMRLVGEAVDAEPIMPAFRGVPVERGALGERSVVCGARVLAERLAKRRA